MNGIPQIWVTGKVMIRKDEYSKAANMFWEK